MTLLLSIVIPTYNGLSTLGATVTSVLTQWNERDVEGKVELSFGVDGSMDGTAEWLAPLAMREPERVRVTVHPQNFGQDRNVDFLVRHATGDFVWILSDDDYLTPGALARVVAAVEEHPDMGAVFCDWIPQPDWENHALGDRVPPLASAGRCADGTAFFRAVSDRGGLISSYVVQRAAWVETTCLQHIGSNWLAFATMIRFMVRRPGFVLVEKQVVMGTVRNRWQKGGRGLYLSVYMMDLYEEMRALGYAGDLVDEHLTKTHRYSWMAIIAAKAGGLPWDWALIRRMARHHGRFWDFWVLRLPLFLLPHALCRALVRGHEQRTGTNAVEALELEPAAREEKLS